MPSGSVYFVLPSRIALIAASLTKSGVSKSGSPAPRPMTSRPAAFNARAFALTAIVGEGLIRPREALRKFGGSGTGRSPCGGLILRQAQDEAIKPKLLMVSLSNHEPGSFRALRPYLSTRRNERRVRLSNS